MQRLHVVILVHSRNFCTCVQCSGFHLRWFQHQNECDVPLVHVVSSTQRKILVEAMVVKVVCLVFVVEDRSSYVWP